MIYSKRYGILFLCAVFIQCASHPSANQSSEKDTAVVKASSIQGAPKDSFAVNKIIPNVRCANAPYSYAVFLPKNFDKQHKFPVVLFFDPHGKGSFPLVKYSGLANEFNCILIGSNDSKNGLTEGETDQVVKALIGEAMKRFPVDEKSLTLAGFSGGGKVALSGAMQNSQVTAVVYGGAATDISSSQHLIPVLGFAGINDMNYTDLMSFDQSLQKTQFPHLLIEWNGKHEWPDSITFRDAFYFVLFNQMKADSTPDKALIDHFLSEKKAKLMNKDVLVKASTNGEIVFMLVGLTDVFPYQGNLEQIMAGDAFKTAIAKKGNLLAVENNYKSGYVQALQNKDISWWKGEISRLQNDHDPADAAMNQRLLGFISLACFSVSTNTIQSHRYDEAEQMLAIYQLADPKNSDQPFLQACLFAQQGKTDDAIQSLQYAVQLGMRDSARAVSEPMLQPLQENAAFYRVLHDMNSLPPLDSK